MEELQNYECPSWYHLWAKFLLYFLYHIRIHANIISLNNRFRICCIVFISIYISLRTFLSIYFSFNILLYFYGILIILFTNIFSMILFFGLHIIDIHFLDCICSKQLVKNTAIQTITQLPITKDAIEYTLTEIPKIDEIIQHSRHCIYCKYCVPYYYTHSLLSNTCIGKYNLLLYLQLLILELYNCLVFIKLYSLQDFTNIHTFLCILIYMISILPLFGYLYSIICVILWSMCRVQYGYLYNHISPIILYKFSIQYTLIFFSNNNLPILFQIFIPNIKHLFIAQKNVLKG